MGSNFDTSRLTPTKAAVRTAEWSVHIAEIHLLRQMELIEELERDGHSTVEAKGLLRILEGTLEAHQHVLDGLLAAP